MIDCKIVYEWYVTHNSTPFDVSIKFDVPIEQAYELIKAGSELAI